MLLRMFLLRVPSACTYFDEIRGDIHAVVECSPLQGVVSLCTHHVEESARFRSRPAGWMFASSRDVCPTHLFVFVMDVFWTFV